MRTGTAQHGDVDLFWIDEGPPDGEVVVLVNGAGSTAVMWCRELIDPLVAAGHRVVRFDNRDVGRSTRIPASEPYTIDDLVGDLGAVLDALEIDAAHLVGRSMGGATVMAFAAERLDRVRSLTLMYTSPCFARPEEYGLPGPREWVIDAMTEAAFEPPPRSDDERIGRRIAETRLYAGDRYPFDDEWARHEAVGDVQHAPHAEPAHGSAVMASPSLVPELSSLNCPALVLHGTADPIVDVAHGRFLAAQLPDAELVEYPGLGHEMPPSFCREIVPVLLRLYSRPPATASS